MASTRKRGDKYQVQIRRKGQSLSRSFLLRKDAETWARQTDVQADRFDLPTDRKALERVTLGELVQRYRDTVTLHKKRRETETIVLNAFLRHPICRKTLSELHTADFADYRDERLKTIKSVSLKRELVTIQNLFEIARTEWNVPVRENPIQHLKFKAKDQRRERRLREGEYDLLVEAARSRKNPYVLPVIILAVETGMRRGEILAIQSEHFDPERRSLLIPQTKNGHSRIIPLTPGAYALLHGCGTDEHRETNEEKDRERMFPITANAFRLAWERVKVKAGVHDLHFRDLRHEAISRFFELGLTTPKVAAISGHRDMRMLFRYAHASQKAIQEKQSGMSE